MKFNKPISSFLNPWVVLMARHRPTMNKSGRKDNFRVAAFGLILVLVATHLPGEVNAARVGNCSEEFRRPTLALAPIRDPASIQSAWQQSMEVLPPIYEQSGSPGQVIEALTTAILAKESVFINGSIGTSAEVFVSLIIFEFLMKAAPRAEKVTFTRVFFDLLTAGKLRGFAETSAQMAFWQENLGPNPFLDPYNTVFLLTSVARNKLEPTEAQTMREALNDHKDLLGANMVDAMLSTGVLTSHSHLHAPQRSTHSDVKIFLTSHQIEIHSPRKRLNPTQDDQAFHFFLNYRPSRGHLPLYQLDGLPKRVHIPGNILAELSLLAQEFAETDKGHERLPTDDFSEEADSTSARTDQYTRERRAAELGRLVKIVQAEHIARQLLRRVPYEHLRFDVKPEDVVLFRHLASPPDQADTQSADPTSAQSIWQRHRTRGSQE